MTAPTGTPTPPAAPAKEGMLTRTKTAQASDGDIAITMTEEIINTINEGGKGHKEAALKKLNSLLMELKTAKERNKDKDSSEAISKHLASIDKRLATIEAETQSTHATLKNAKTWAQVASSPPLPQLKVNISPEKKQFLENARKQRGQYEVTLTTTAANTETKEEIKTNAIKDIKTRLQKPIDEADITGKPILRAINKIGENTLRLQFQTTEEATAVRKTDINWNTAYPGVQIHKPQYGIVVHRIEVEAINLDENHDETIREWESINEEKKIKISRITTLRRQDKHKPAAHQSLIIFTEKQDAANNCIELGFVINHRRHKVDKYAPHLHVKQCYNCHNFGHIAAQCKKKSKCGKCGEGGHRVADCKAEHPHCINCKENHEAWNITCPARNEEGRRLKQLRIEAPPQFQ